MLHSGPANKCGETTIRESECSKLPVSILLLDIYENISLFNGTNTLPQGQENLNNISFSLNCAFAINARAFLSQGLLRFL